MQQAGGCPFVGVRMAGGQAEMSGAGTWQSGPCVAQPVGRLFASWDWDGRVLRAGVDPFGFFNLYVYEKAGEVMISPSLLELVARGADTARNDLALAVFHRIGIFIHDETPLRHVRVLPPGGQLVWSEGRLEITGGVEMPVEVQISREGAVEGMTHHFREGMARILDAWDAPLALPLSGGRDSRHILLEMLHQGRRPETCVTFHHNGALMNAEAQAARAVCARAGVAHDVLGYARPRLADALRNQVMTSLCADEHAQMMPLYDYFLGRDVAAFDGIAGDILTNPDGDAERFYRLAMADDYTGIARGLVEGHGGVISQQAWRRGAGPLYSPGRDDEVLEHIGRAVAAYADAPDPYQVFWMYHRTRREVNFVPQAILSSAKAVFCPYLDEEFARFCMSLPYSITRDQQLHNDCIAQAYPDYADIPFAEGFRAPAPQSGGILHKLRSGMDVLRITSALDARGQARAFLGEPAKLKRAPDTAYRLHDLCLSGLDAGKARALLDLAAKLEADRPSRLISDRI